jgi:hypothetical protein
MSEGPHRPLVAAVKRNVRRMAMGGVTPRVILAVLIVFTILILTSPVRTVQLQARTLSAEVELTAEPLGWNVTGATVCVPATEEEDLFAEPVAPCGAGQVFDVTILEPVVWSRGQRLALDWTQEHLRIRLLNEGNGWPAGTVLSLDQADATRNGALALSGFLSLGQEMSPGSTGYVLDGNYAIYEQGLVSRWIGWSPDVTRQGVIRRGDQVQIVCAQSLARSCEGDPMTGRIDHYKNPVAGSISVDHDGKAGVHIIATGTEANSLIEVAYAGRDSILLIKPSWVQRAAASSSLLALSLLFSLIAPILLPMLDRKSRER